MRPQMAAFRRGQENGPPSEVPASRYRGIPGETQRPGRKVRSLTRSAPDAFSLCREQSLVFTAFGVTGPRCARPLMHRPLMHMRLMYMPQMSTAAGPNDR
jgi:hypothetical protein